MNCFYADIRQSDGSLQTVEIMAESLRNALAQANEKYGVEAVAGVADTLAFGWKGEKPSS